MPHLGRKIMEPFKQQVNIFVALRREHNKRKHSKMIAISAMKLSFSKTNS